MRRLAQEDGRHLGPGARDRGPWSGLTSRRDGRASMCRNLDTLKRFMAAETERAQPRRLGASALRCTVGSYPGLPQLPAPPARSLWTTRPDMLTANRKRLRPILARPRIALLPCGRRQPHLSANSCPEKSRPDARGTTAPVGGHVSHSFRDHSSVALGLDLQDSSLRLFNDLRAVCPTTYFLE